MSQIPINLGLEEVIVPKELFAVDKIDSVCIYMSKWGGKWHTTATVKFKFKQTGGEQSFSGEGLDDVIAQIKAYLIDLTKA